MEVAITNTQQGVITEAEFAKIAILTSNGRLVPTRALADDDRRDFEIHIRRHFRESLAVQLKTAKHLRLHGRSRPSVRIAGHDPQLKLRSCLEGTTIRLRAVWFRPRVSLVVARFTSSAMPVAGLLSCILVPPRHARLWHHAV